MNEKITLNNENLYFLNKNDIDVKFENNELNILIHKISEDE